MKTIPLTKGYMAAVRDEDHAKVKDIKWCAKRNKSGNVYAYNSKVGFMHRVILGINREDWRHTSRRVIFLDGNGLNNRRENLCIATLKREL